jgi:poly(A) polymerase
VVRRGSVLDAWCGSAARYEVARLITEGSFEAYAVGGAVRDALMGRDPHDWDLLAPQAAQLARHLAAHLRATLVTLHPDPPTFRLVFDPHGEAREEIDLCAPRGASLREDLLARDFTINSVAWRIGTDEEAVLDPAEGLSDVKARLVRANSLDVLRRDPLRCLRAFRLAAELRFAIEPRTMEWIAGAAPGIENVAGERIGTEFVRLVAQPGLAYWLQQADSAGVLERFLPEFSLLKGVEQGGYHHLDVWGHTLLVVDDLECILNGPESVFPTSADMVGEYCSNAQRVPRLKLAALFHDIAKPQSRAIVEGRVRFIGHETLGMAMVSDIAGRLHLPRDVRHTLSALTHWHMRPIMLVDQTSEPSVSAVRRLLRDCDPDGVGVVVLAAADLLACRGPATDPAEQWQRLRTLDHMLADYRDWSRGQEFQPLLRGRDLVQELGLEPGPQFTILLTAVEQAQLEGTVRTREEALEMARRLLRDGV